MNTKNTTKLFPKPCRLIVFVALCMPQISCAVDEGPTAFATQLSDEQAMAFDSFRKADKSGRGLDQQISDFAIKSGVSMDAIRNHLGKSAKMSEEERREWEKGSAYKEQQRRIREKQRAVEIEQKRRANEVRRQERKKVAHAQTAALNKRRDALVGKATLKEITEILGDSGVAKSFAALRDRKKYGGRLTENEQTFYEEKAKKIGIWMERKEMRKAGGPLHEEYVPTKDEAKAIAESDRRSRKLMKERQDAKGKRYR